VRKKRTKTNYKKIDIKQDKNIPVLTFKTRDRVYQVEIDRIEDESKKTTKQNSQ
jgi:desulfoferrodoxin (superoxide reductase-like protein)